MGFHKIAKYYYYPGWHEPGTTLETMINKSAFESLPADLQAIVKAAILRQNHWTISVFESQNNRYLRKLVEEENVQLRAFPDEVLASFRSLTQQVLADMTASDPLSQKVYAAYQAFQRDAQEWAQVTERIFHNSLQA